MCLDIMNPTSKFIEGVVEECFRQGLTEKQASIVLDHAAYRAREFTKQAGDDPVNSGRARSILQMLAHTFLESPGAANPLRMVEKHRDYRGPKDALHAFNENADLISSYRTASEIAYKTLKDEFEAAGKSINSDEFHDRLIDSTGKTFISSHLQNTRRSLERAEAALRNTRRERTHLYKHREDLYNKAFDAHEAAKARLAAQLRAIHNPNDLPTDLRGIKRADGTEINTIAEFDNYYNQVKNEVAARHSNKDWHEQSPREWLIRLGGGYTDEELQEAEKYMQKIRQHEDNRSALDALGLTESVVDGMLPSLTSQDEALAALREGATRRRNNQGNTQAQAVRTPRSARTTSSPVSSIPQPERTPSAPTPSTTQTSSQTPRRWSDMSVLDMARATNPSASLLGNGFTGPMPSLTSIQVNNI